MGANLDNVCTQTAIRNSSNVYAAQVAIGMGLPPEIILDAFERAMEGLRARDIPFECVVKIKEFFWLGPVLPFSC